MASSEAWHDAGEKHGADRLLGKERVENHQQAGRDQHSQHRRACDDAGGKARGEAEAQHLRHGDLGEDRGRGDRDAGDGGEHGVRHHRRHAQPAADAAKHAVGDLENVLAQVGRRHQQAHQDEQRHHAELVAGDRIVGRLRHQRQRHVDIVAHQPDADEGQQQQGDGDMQPGDDQNDHHGERDDADAERCHGVPRSALRKSARARKM